MREMEIGFGLLLLAIVAVEPTERLWRRFRNLRDRRQLHRVWSQDQE